VSHPLACALALAVVPALLPLTAAAAQRVEPPVRQRVAGTLNMPGRQPVSAATLRRLRVPRGFAVSVFADSLGAPRMLAVGGDGTVYVTRRDSGDVVALRDTDGDGRADERRRVVSNIPQVHGIAIHRGTMYLASVREIWRAAVNADGTVGEPTLVVNDLPDGGQHPNRTLAVGPDGMLYVSVGSSCNACVETNPEHATILRMRPDGSDRSVHARGLRNTIGWGWQPQTGELWGMDHGTDWRGDGIPPEELNRIQQGRHYGWPFCWGEQRVDSAFVGEPPGTTKAAFCPTTVVPANTVVAHSAPIGMVFYTGGAFPQEYRGDAFVAMHGSWNRSTPSGYKVVRIDFEDGRPGAITEFLTGFLSDDGRAFSGRPAGIATTREGALLVGDDVNGVIYRVSYGGPQGR